MIKSCIILVVLALCFAGQAMGQSAKPNIILMVADDLGYRDLSCYGATKVKTPRIDKLCKEGVSFTDAHSICSTCMPSRYAMLSGEYFYHAKHKPGYAFHFRDGQITLPSFLKSNGYRTAALGKWHNGFGQTEEPDWNKELKPGPLEIGFESFFGTPRTHNEPPLVFVQDHNIVGIDPVDPIHVDHDPKFGRWGKTIGGVKAQAARPDDQIDFILAEKASAYFKQQTKDKPFFLYLAFAAPHNPIDPAKEYRGKSEAGLYGDYIQQLDHCAGVVLDALEKQGFAQNTIVVFTSDNGGRYEREALKAGHRPNGELLGQKTDGWEGGHRVPLMARWPNHFTPDSKRKEFFLQVDLMATLAEAIGIALPAGASPDGSSELAAFVSPTSAPAKRIEGLVQSGGSFMFRQGDWVYIPKQGSLGYTAPEPAKPWSLPYSLMGFKNSDVDEKGQIKPDAPKEQLYDLSKDLVQARNVALENPDRLQTMRTRLKELTGKASGKTVGE